jgi:hypothetical protein
VIDCFCFLCLTKSLCSFRVYSQRASKQSSEFGKKKKNRKKKEMSSESIQKKYEAMKVVDLRQKV